MIGRRLVLAFFGFLIGHGAAAAAGWPQAPSDLAPDPAIQFGTLPNGLRYAIKPNAEPRGRTVLRLLVLAGSLHEQEDQRGLAHFVEHMAFNGTRLYPHETLQAALQRHGFAFGADVSAFTFLTHTIYGLEAPSTNPERLDEAFAVLREFADGQTFDPEEIDRERGVIASERRTRD
ncbi:MAG: insulinase family protein, partial [Opitutaceae bacterium]|nr:insulinase family protein [Opitutaceae bacterium]